jgi:hypothetical protein
MLMRRQPLHHVTCEIADGAHCDGVRYAFHCDCDERYAFRCDCVYRCAFHRTRDIPHLERSGEILHE